MGSTYLRRDSGPGRGGPNLYHDVPKGGGTIWILGLKDVNKELMMR